MEQTLGKRREIYFGESMKGRRGSPHVARYVEYMYLFGDHEGGRFEKAGQEEGTGEDWGEEVMPVRFTFYKGWSAFLMPAT